MNWSFQLYSAREFQPWPQVLRRLSELGYAEVEGFGGVYGDPPGLRAELDRNNLKMPTGHFSIDALEGEFDGVRRIADALGVRTLICPHLTTDKRPSDADGWRAFGTRLAAVGERAKAVGYAFAWHNHDFEFQALADGSVPQRLILQATPEIGLELDVAWVARGGGDPLAWIDEFGSRIVAVHVKDIAPAGQKADEDGWDDVGHGVLDWEGLFQTLRRKTPARHFVMEHDKPSDFDRFATRSIAFANGLREVA